MEIIYNKAVNAYLSRTILEVLSEDDPDFERIFTFSIYMQMMAVRCCFPTAAYAKETMEELFDYWTSPDRSSYFSDIEEEKLNDEDFDNFYLQNKELATEIYNNVWHDCSGNFQWLKDWGNICKKVVDKDSSPLQNCIDLNITLNAHLDASHNEFIMILSLIKKTLLESTAKDIPGS